MNGYKIANTIILIALIGATMVGGRAWLAWPLVWKLATALPAVGLFAWLAWRGTQ